VEERREAGRRAAVQTKRSMSKVRLPGAVVGGVQSASTSGVPLCLAPCRARRSPRGDCLGMAPSRGDAALSVVAVLAA